jgi:hypothetical protein
MFKFHKYNFRIHKFIVFDKTIVQKLLMYYLYINFFLYAFKFIITNI